MTFHQLLASILLSSMVLLVPQIGVADEKAEDIKFLVQSMDGNIGTFGNNLKKFKEEAEFEALQRSAFSVRLLCTSIYNRAGDKQYVQRSAEDLEKAVSSMKVGLLALQKRVGAQATMPLILSFSSLPGQAKELRDLAK